MTNPNSNWLQALNTISSSLMSSSTGMLCGFNPSLLGSLSLNPTISSNSLFVPDTLSFNTAITPNCVFTATPSLPNPAPPASSTTYTTGSYSSDFGASFDAEVQRAYEEALKAKGIDPSTVKSKTSSSSSATPATSASSSSSAASTSGVSTVISNSEVAKELERLGYNPEKGKKLAELGLKETETDLDGNKKSTANWIGYCATKVKRAMQKAGLGGYEYGHAFAMVDQLSNNSNFKRLSTTNIDLNSLPAGCIIVYGKGVARYSHDYGHVEITVGNGTAASDFINPNIRSNPTAIFVPV